MTGVNAVVLIKAETSPSTSWPSSLPSCRASPRCSRWPASTIWSRWCGCARTRACRRISNRMRKLSGILGTETLIAFRVYTKAELSAGFDMD